MAGIYVLINIVKRGMRAREHTHTHTQTHTLSLFLLIFMINVTSDDPINFVERRVK